MRKPVQSDVSSHRHSRTVEMGEDYRNRRATAARRPRDFKNLTEKRHAMMGKTREKPKMAPPSAETHDVEPSPEAPPVAEVPQDSELISSSAGADSTSSSSSKQHCNGFDADRQKEQTAKWLHLTNSCSHTAGDGDGGDGNGSGGGGYVVPQIVVNEACPQSPGASFEVDHIMSGGEALCAADRRKDWLLVSDDADRRSLYGTPSQLSPVTVIEMERLDNQDDCLDAEAGGRRDALRPENSMQSDSTGGCSVESGQEGERADGEWAKREWTEGECGNTEKANGEQGNGELTDGEYENRELADREGVDGEQAGEERTVDERADGEQGNREWENRERAFSAFHHVADNESSCSGDREKPVQAGGGLSRVSTAADGYGEEDDKQFTTIEMGLARGDRMDLLLARMCSKCAPYVESIRCDVHPQYPVSECHSSGPPEELTEYDLRYGKAHNERLNAITQRLWKKIDAVRMRLSIQFYEDDTDELDPRENYQTNRSDLETPESSDFKQDTDTQSLDDYSCRTNTSEEDLGSSTDEYCAETKTGIWLSEKMYASFEQGCEEDNEQLVVGVTNCQLAENSIGGANRLHPPSPFKAHTGDDVDRLHRLRQSQRRTSLCHKQACFDFD